MVRTRVNDQGFSLVEVLVAAAISTVVMLGVGSVMDYTTRSAHSSEKVFDSIEFMGIVSELTLNPDYCKATFNGTPFPPAGQTTQSAGQPHPTLQYAGTTWGDPTTPPATTKMYNQAIKINSITFTSAAATTATVGIGTLDVQVDIQGNDKVAPTGPRFRTKSFPVSFSLVGGNVTDCVPNTNSKYRGEVFPGLSLINTGVAGKSISVTYPWSIPFTDNLYAVSCSLGDIGFTTCSPGVGCIWINNVTHTPTTVTISVSMGNANQAKTTGILNINCVAVHQ